MPQGTIKQMAAWGLKKDRGLYAETDTLTLVYVSDTFASISSTAANPQLSDLTVESGGNVPASTTLANYTITGVGDEVTFDADDPATILKDAANPDNVRCAVVINDTSANDDICFAFDLTTDGNTPIDLDTQDFSFMFHADGITKGTYNNG